MKKTQEQIAAYLNISQQTYANYENGTTQASYDILQKLADYFNITVDYLLGREEKEQKQTPPVIDNFTILKRGGSEAKLTPEQRKLVEDLVANLEKSNIDKI